jgi:N-acetylneuraminic acid mutarotase
VAYEGGGYSFSAPGTINEFGSFDPVANDWTSLAPVPDLENAEASAVFAPNVNKLFVFGGENPDTVVVVNTTRIYDVATNTWSTGAPMPDIRAFMASGYFNGKIYLVGGYNTGNVDPSFGQVWEYDPVTNTFDTSRTSMPATLGGAGFGVINGHLYVAGGRDVNNTNLNTLYDYDIAADTWTQRANLPSGINVPGSAVIDGTLWVFSGGNPFSGGPKAMPTVRTKGKEAPDTTNILQIYDPIGDSWTTGPSLNLVRSFTAGTDVGNTAVAVGGYDGFGTIASVEINASCAGGTPTPTPSCTPIVVNGSIDSGDPTQVDRLFRSGVPQTCPASTTCAIFGDPTPHHYDAYTFTNTTGAPQCVTVDPTTECVGENYIFAAAYLGSFDPNNICTNWIGDSGSSPDPTQPPVTFQFDVDPGQTFVLVASEVTPGAGCPAYTLTITGLCGGGGGNLELTANGRKVGGVNTVNLHWRGASSSDIDVYRSQQGGGGFTLIATTPNDGSYQDSTGTSGKASFKYKVCEAGTQNCSNKKAVIFKR